MTSTLPEAMTREVAEPRPAFGGFAAQYCRNSGVVLDAARSGNTSPSRRKIEPRLALHNLTAEVISVSRTACRSKLERLMTLSTSAVAACCASNSSRRRCRLSMTCGGTSTNFSVTINFQNNRGPPAGLCNLYMKA